MGLDLWNPTSAVYDPVAGTLDLTGTRNLATLGPLPTVGWSGRGSGRLIDFTGGTYTAGPADTIAQTGLAVGAIDAGPNVITYDGSDPLLVDSDGQPVPAFTDFPLTVV